MASAECQLNRDISAITNSPEILKGRVKTLHPTVHAGILSTDSESDKVGFFRSIHFCCLYKRYRVMRSCGQAIRSASPEKSACTSK